MDDKRSLVGLLDDHAAVFGQGVLKSASADKGYWSAKNSHELGLRGVQENGMQRPAHVKIKSEHSNSATQERLRNRRAGIEPLIGHAKHGGQLGKSRMKSDQATLAAGYGSVLQSAAVSESAADRTTKGSLKKVIPMLKIDGRKVEKPGNAPGAVDRVTMLIRE